MRLIFFSCCYNEEVSDINIMRTLWDMKGERESEKIHNLDAWRESSFAGDRFWLDSRLQSAWPTCCYSAEKTEMSGKWNESLQNQLRPDLWPSCLATAFPRWQRPEQILSWISEIYGDDSGWRVIPLLLHTVIRTWTPWEHKFVVVTVIPVNVGRLPLPL